MEKVPQFKPYFRQRPLLFHDNWQYRDFLLNRKKIYKFIHLLTAGKIDSPSYKNLFKMNRRTKYISNLGPTTREPDLLFTIEYIKSALKTLKSVCMLNGEGKRCVPMASKLFHNKISKLRMKADITCPKWIAYAKPSLKTLILKNIDSNTKDYLVNSLKYLRCCRKLELFEIVSDGAEHIIEAESGFQKLASRVKINLRLLHPAPGTLERLKYFNTLEVVSSFYGDKTILLQDLIRCVCPFRNLRSFDLVFEGTKCHVYLLSNLKNLNILKELSIKISPVNKCDWNLKDLIEVMTLPREVTKMRLIFSRIALPCEIDSSFMNRYEKCLEGIKDLEDACSYANFLAQFEQLKRLENLALGFDYAEDRSSYLYHALAYAIVKRCKYIKDICINIQTLMEDEDFCVFDLNFLTQFLPKDIQKISLEIPTLGTRKVPMIPHMHNLKKLYVNVAVRMVRSREHQDGIMQLLKAIGPLNLQHLEFKGADVKSLEAIMNPWNFKTIEYANFLDIDDTQEKTSPLKLVNMLVSKPYLTSFRLTFIKGNWDREEFRKCVDSLISNNKLLHFSLWSPKMSVQRIYKDIIVRDK